MLKENISFDFTQVRAVCEADTFVFLNWSEMDEHFWQAIPVQPGSVPHA